MAQLNGTSGETAASASSGPSGTAPAQRRAMRRLAEADPELGARLIVQSLPLAAAALPDDLTYRLELRGLGAWRISCAGELAAVEPVEQGELNGDAFAISTDPRTLVRLAAGGNPLPALITRRLRLRGRRRRALDLRALATDAGPRELIRAGAPVDPDLLYRSLAHVIDPEWTRGRSFSVAYELVGEGGGRWVVSVDDGELKAERGDAPADGTVRMKVETWRRLVAGELKPAEAMQRNLTELDGSIPAVTLLGRWIDRAEGRDEAELERERAQRRRQAERAGSWGATVNGEPRGTADPHQAGDPAASESAPRRARRGGLLSHPELYALWERQNWRAHELDFSEDREHWLATPAEAQQHTAFSLGSFYAGEERVTADLAPFLMAAPSGEVEAFLATQLVDEMRHTVFFDRWGAEVMGLESGDMRSRLREIEDRMLGPWHFLFDDSLRDVAQRIQARPDDLELFVEGIVTYHMVTEGVLAMPGQRILIQYTDEHSLYPGFNKGFRLVEQDEHRHIAFGVRFLRDVCDERPEMRGVVLRRLSELLPKAAEVFCPPEADDPSDFVSYGHHSSQIYGFAYRALQRRMATIGVEIPGPEELMPGPVSFEGLDERRPLAERFAAEHGNGAAPPEPARPRAAVPA